MRKAIFAVMLVGASFAGGAVVNGPGLHWAQTMILSHLNNSSDDGDNKDEDADKTADAEAAPKSTVGQEPLAPIPSDPISPAGAVVADPSSSLKEASPPAGAESSAVAADQRPQPAAPTPPTSNHDQLLGAKATEFAAAPAELKSSSDPEIALTNVPTPLPEDPPTSQEPLDPLPPLSAPNASTSPSVHDHDKDQDKDPGKGPDSGWGDAPGSAPAAAVPPRPFGTDPSASPKPAPGTGTDQGPAKNASALAVAAPQPPSDWAEIRRRMAALGVSRYGIEGEPNGKVRFHCVIPLAGRRAIAQQFEAEGDDELQAAEVALRRVALWRATENPGP